MSRVILKQGLQQVQAIFIQSRNKHTALHSFPFGEGRLEVREAGDTGPCDFVWGSKESGGYLDHVFLLLGGHVPEDLEDLINFRITREQGLAGAHLCKDSTARPHVDTGGILTTAEENLGRAIPECHDLAN